MAKYLSILAFLLLVGCNEVSNELSLDGSIDPQQMSLIFEKSREFPEGTQVSFALIKEDTVTFYGVKQEDDKLITIDNHLSTFEIGSISKVFTSTLLASAVVEGKVALDDPIGGYLAIPLKEQQTITFKNLANHTSGLPRLPSNLTLSRNTANNPYKNYGEDELLAYLSDELESTQKDVANYSYSNLGAGLLGYLLCKIDSADYQELLEKKILSKYGMLNTSSRKEDIMSTLVEGRDAKENVTPNWDFISLVGAGGVLSSVSDLSKFALAQFDSTNIELELTRQPTFTVNDKLKSGLAWQILKRNSGAEWYMHNGATGGYRSCLLLDPNKKVGVIILSNVSAFHKKSDTIDGLAFELMDTL